MPALRELQTAFRAALLDGDARGLAPAIIEDGLAVSARLAVYRHHVLMSLTAALEATYPVVCRLVDRRFFAYAADRYIRTCPPLTPCLFEYGASFADFLRDFPPCAHLVYLPDVARLEWAMNVALHAPDLPGLDADALRALGPRALVRGVVRFDPSVSLLASPWPVDRIWRANQPGADTTAVVDLDAGGARLEVRRVGEDVVFRSLPPGVFTFRTALTLGRTLAQAAASALADDPTLDIASVVRALVDERLLVAVG